MSLNSFSHIVDKNVDGRLNSSYVLRSNSIFIFIFFSDRRTLKSLRVKCNPTNKKIVALQVMEHISFLNSVVCDGATWDENCSTMTQCSIERYRHNTDSSQNKIFSIP